MAPVLRDAVMEYAVRGKAVRAVPRIVAPVLIDVEMEYAV